MGSSDFRTLRSAVGDWHQKLAFSGARCWPSPILMIPEARSSTWTDPTATLWTHIRRDLRIHLRIATPLGKRAGSHRPGRRNVPNRNAALPGASRHRGNPLFRHRYQNGPQTASFIAWHFAIYMGNCAYLHLASRVLFNLVPLDPRAWRQGGEKCDSERASFFSALFRSRCF